MSKHLTEQKGEERFYFEQFKSLYNKTLIEEKEDGTDPDPKPDFRIRLPSTPKKIIGIELREFQFQEVRKNIEDRDKIIQLSEKFYLGEKGVQYLRGLVMIDFNSRIDKAIKKKKIKNVIASRIASCIQNEFSNHSQKEFSYSELRKYELEQFIDVMYMHGYPTHPDLFWSCLHEAFRSRSLLVPHIIEGMKEVAADKEKNLSEYLKRCSECWLLIYGSPHYSHVNLREEVEETEQYYHTLFMESSFSKIFFFNSQKIVKLKS